MGFNDYSTHSYRITRLSKPGKEGKEIGSHTVLGSIRAFHDQQYLEEQGLPVSVFNLTKGVEEYRTGVEDEDE